jgi:hypothetical protein
MIEEKDLENIIIPPATVTASNFSGTVSYKLSQNQKLWYLEGTIDNGTDRAEDEILLEAEDVIDILEGTLDIDQYCQDEEFQNHQKELAKRLVMKLGEKINRNTVEVKLGQYLRQQHIKKTSGINLLRVLIEKSKNTTKFDIPDHLRVEEPKNYIPDEELIEAVLQRIYEGTPATAILGPTGSGKTVTARYIASQLNKEGYGVHVIDANARLEGDRLFDRDDFDANGTFILEGVLCQLARETKKLGLKLLVILEEYNALNDETRREFYRLFSDEQRIYKIQSTKNNQVLNQVDFGHVQFLITANPLTSEKYLTDDLKRLSNAETRRINILYQDYTFEDSTIKKILQSLIHKKKGYQTLRESYPEIDEQINYQLGIDIFKELNKRGEGQSLGYDIGYTNIADMLWTAILSSHQSGNFVSAITEHILNPIPDISIRSLAAERIRQAVGIEIPHELITRDA